MSDLFEGKGDQPAETKSKRSRAKKPEASEATIDLKAKNEPQASAEARTELVVAEAQTNPVALFTDEKRYSDFYERIKATVSSHVPDVSTAKGRDEIRSLAFRVTKAKTSLDKAGLGLTEEARKLIKTVNESRAKMTGELDELAKEVRKPLTDWEEAEKAREERVNRELNEIRLAATVGEEETSEEVEKRGRELYERELDPELFQDRLEEAQGAKDASVLALLKARDRLKKEEDDRAELERLRAEAREREEREARERAEREAREAEERKLEEAARSVREHIAEVAGGTIGGTRQPFGLLIYELEHKVVIGPELGKYEEEVRGLRDAALAKLREAMAEEARKREEEAQAAEAQRVREAEERAAQAERDRVERERQEAEQAREAERQREAEERERQHQEELKRAQEEKEAAERVAEEARARDAERQERERQDQLDREKREADTKHRQTVASEAVQDLIDASEISGEDMEPLTKAQARRIVMAIVNREIRHISIQF